MVGTSLVFALGCGIRVEGCQRSHRPEACLRCCLLLIAVEALSVDRLSGATGGGKDTLARGTIPETALTGSSLATMSGQGGTDAVNEATRAGGGDTAGPELKRRRLLDAGGPIEDDETARRKMRDAGVGEDGVLTGFDPDDVVGIKCLSGLGEDDIFRIKPMGYFATEGDLPMTRWLYVNGADTRDEEVKFYFPMYAAALDGRLEMCKWLGEHGTSKDIKRRNSNDLSPLSVTFGKFHRRDLSRWLVLKGALCKDDGSGDLDLGVMRKDLDRNQHCAAERHLLLEWANGLHQTRQAFFVFLMGTLSPPEYSPSALRNILLTRLLSEKATDQILGSMPQHQQLWENLIGDEECACLANRLFGASGVLEMIGDYAGVVKGREARIIRQLTEILPDLNVELDQKYER